MKYAEAIEAIKAMENGDELAAAVLAEVQEKGKETAGVRAKLKAFDGVDPTKYSSLLESLQSAEIDVEGDIADQISNMRANGKQKETEASKTQKLLERIQKELAEEKGLRQAAEQKTEQKTVENAFLPLFNDKVLNPVDTLKYRMSQGEFVMQDGEPGYMDDGLFVSQKDGGFERFIQKNPTIIRNSQKGGSGSGAGDHAPTGKKFTFQGLKQMTPNEYNALSDDDRAEARRVMAAGPNG